MIASDPPPPFDRPGNGREAPEDDAPGSLTPGMAMVRKAVAFTNAQVLGPTAALQGAGSAPMDASADALAESAGAMMLQDMRSYLQSTEMILVPVAAAAFAEILAGNTEPGEIALQQIEKLLGYLTAFSTAVIANAATIKADFG